MLEKARGAGSLGAGVVGESFSGTKVGGIWMRGWGEGTDEVMERGQTQRWVLSTHTHTHTLLFDLSRTPGYSA